MLHLEHSLVCFVDLALSKVVAMSFRQLRRQTSKRTASKALLLFVEEKKPASHQLAQLWRKTVCPR